MYNYKGFPKRWGEPLFCPFKRIVKGNSTSGK
jgi:hypothetical protein